MAHELHDVAVKLAREAGELIVTRRAGHIEVASTKSSDVDVVTAVDKESEEFLYTRLRELRPGDGFLGEEGQVEESTTGSPGWLTPSMAPSTFSTTFPTTR
jgi:myo-inositol-1(or 4)-monophosphatase